MNYGWADPAGQTIEEELPVDNPQERLSALLYHRTANAVTLNGKRLLEVGCGRGGGLALVHRTLELTESVGVDFSRKAIALCRNFHHQPGLAFTHGDAEALPFPDSSFDAVLNVDSSHCYGSMPTFLSEVKRVLVHGGHFLFTDLCDDPEKSQFFDAIENCQMKILEKENVTAGVVEALNQVHLGNVARINENIPSPFRRIMLVVAATKGTPIYEEFRTGWKIYMRYVLRK